MRRIANAILGPAMFAGLASGVAVRAKMNERPGDAGVQAGLRAVASAAGRIVWDRDAGHLFYGESAV